jgi:hypothetical protein
VFRFDTSALMVAIAVPSTFGPLIAAKHAILKLEIAFSAIFPIGGGVARIGAIQRKAVPIAPLKGRHREMGIPVELACLVQDHRLGVKNKMRT